ncbi:PQQ-like beta-propeller repeat protein [bacterium]|nr:PQQ-like beta-propeller repeat protein [bacterium]
MSKFEYVCVCLFFVPVFVLGADPPGDFEKNWPQWRGPYANGVVPYGNPPEEWSETQNIKWKIELPGKGHATPVIWDNQIFVLSAIETDRKVEPGTGEQTKAKTVHIPRNVGTSNIHKYVIFAINRLNGQIIWQQTAREELPHEGTHPTGTWASSSPLTDGEHVYAYFGSKGLFCYDLDGNPVWEKDFGDMNIKRGFGEGSSPALHNDKIIVNWDHEGQSFIIALDKKTGKELWKVDRDEGTSWATPFIVESNGLSQVITSATGHIRSYDLATGMVLWESTGMTMNVIPSPVEAEGVVYVMSGFRGNALQAIRLSEAQGDISGSKAIVWTLDRDTPYTPSPLLYNDVLYFLKGNDGVLACFNAITGEEYFSRQKLKGIGTVYASPIGAGGRIYISSRNGTTQVIKQDTQYELLAVNKLDDSFSASPVVVDDELYLRGEKYLYCIAEK